MFRPSLFCEPSGFSPFHSGAGSFLSVLCPLLTSLIPITWRPRPPLVRAFSFLQCLRYLLHRDKVTIGLRKAVVAYPLFIASYTVPVRQYRILQSGFLQCMPHDKPPCHLLTLPGVTPACKGLSPSGKKITLVVARIVRKICIFLI